MNEKFYWGLAALIAGGLIFVGVYYFPPVLVGLHVLSCGILILVVLLQSGRAADLAGAFGGAGSQTAFGPRGAATLLSKATSFLAIVFMLTSLSLAIFGGRIAASSVVPVETPATEQPAEQKPAEQQQPPQQQPGQQPPPQQQPPPPPK
ncbi:MAG: preprotein translocase subunit SecG [Acidobacteria bacterium]|nr:preprotein translocase subunit SecG [Acidobacteriota bacterium]